MINQSFKQNVILSNNDIGNLLSLSLETIGKHIKEVEFEKDIILPARNAIHDLGSKISHKVWRITKNILEHRTIKETMAATHHQSRQLTNIENYCT